MTKHKKIHENTEKKSFVYRIQDAENPLWLRYLPEFDSFYLSIPNDVAKSINKEIKSVCGEGSHFNIKMSSEYETSSTGVTAYEETLEGIKSTLRNNVCRVQDVILSIKPSKLAGKLSKVMTEIKVIPHTTSYMVGDDFFDDLGKTEAVVDSDAMPDQEMPPMPDVEAGEPKDLSF